MSNFHRNSNIMVHISNYMSLSRVVQAAEGLLLLVVNIISICPLYCLISHIFGIPIGSSSSLPILTNQVSRSYHSDVSYIF